MIQNKVLSFILTALLLAPIRLRVESLASALKNPSSSMTTLCSIQGVFMQHLLSSASPHPSGYPEIETSLREGCYGGVRIGEGVAGRIIPAPNSSEEGWKEPSIAGQICRWLSSALC